jgi:hypothetical protein
MTTAVAIAGNWLFKCPRRACQIPLVQAESARNSGGDAPRTVKTDLPGAAMLPRTDLGDFAERAYPEYNQK